MVFQFQFQIQSQKSLENSSVSVDDQSDGQSLDFRSINNSVAKLNHQLVKIYHTKPTT